MDTHGQLAPLPSTNDDDLCERILASGRSMLDIETKLLDFAVTRARGNLSEASRLLGLTRAQLAYRIKSRHMADTHVPGSD